MSQKVVKKGEQEILTKREQLLHPSPMMQQYLDIKEQYEGVVLLYRLGDFFEMFFEDALIGSEALGLALTARDCGDGKRASMCGIPFHKADEYIGKLVNQGYKIAICEQTEDPSQAQGLVKREVIRMVTPGTVTDAEVLVDGKNNYLASVCVTDGGIGLGFVDVSTGDVMATYLTGSHMYSDLQNELDVYAPREIVVNLPLRENRMLASILQSWKECMITEDRTELFATSAAIAAVRHTFGELGDRVPDEAVLRAVGALVSYIRETQKCDASFLRELRVYSDGQYVEIDVHTRRNLELTETMRTKEKHGSLLWVLDKTKTAMGARLLRSWIVKPLLNPCTITRRQGAVADFTEDLIFRSELRELLSSVLDMERLMARVVYGSANAKDLLSIASSIRDLPQLREMISECRSPVMQEIAQKLDPLSDIYELLFAAIDEKAPYSVREGGMIRAGFHKDVDHLRSLKDNGKAWKDEIEAQEREATGIKTLRVGFNKVFGYYIEVTNSLVDQVPDRYVRKQTLSNCERYITQELKEMETTVLGAEEKLCALEYSIFTEIRQAIAKEAARVQETASLVAEVDVYLSLATVAVNNHYVCPEVHLGKTVTIKEGRHPVVERFVKDSYFVPNDTYLDGEGQRTLLITGPNMAGKSTYMRQVALIVLMAQIGSYVPAAEAQIGIVDKIFTRIGASDDLASGQSTFMLEMTEVAEILKNGTERSLIIYDEVGRGTSTYDGMSIARAVVEYTNTKIRAKTLFATHYHELTEMEHMFEGILNYHVVAKKKGESVTFLRRVVRGCADDSYGIEVAKLAGVPNEVLRRAKEILAGLEASEPMEHKPVRAAEETASMSLMDALYDSEAGEVANALRELDINTLTPIEAMNLIFAWKKKLSDR